MSCDHRQATVHLISGPIGAGKSTFAISLAKRKRAVRFTLDDWMKALFLSDTPTADAWPWTVERLRRCQDLIWSLSMEVLDLDVDVVLDVALINRMHRATWARRCKTRGVPSLRYFLDADRTTRRERVFKRNLEDGPTFAITTTPEIFDAVDAMFEYPDALELEDATVLWTG